jgi:pyruvate dehydrogenase E2 component (dihydrolipoamide acetyltransferase)
MATNILMPALSPTMEEGKLAKWHVKEGDTVKTGDILAEIETDKATMEFEAIDEGRIGKILVAEGTEGVKVNATIAVLLAEGESADASPSSKAPPSKPEEISSAMSEISKALASETASAPATPKAEPAKASAQAESGARVFASPLAKRIAANKGVDLSGLTGSGPRGRIVKADVENARPGADPAAAASAPQAVKSGDAGISGVTPLPDARLFYAKDAYEETPHDSMRKTIAKRLTSAKTLIPHYYLTIDCDITALMDVRARMNAKSPKANGYKLSVNDFVMKAAAMALIKHPDVNASWTETAILRHKHADVGVAVALDGGLITPIVFQAEKKGLVDISNEVKALADKAKNKKLKPSEFEGGSFSVSNLGMFGIKQFTAVINPPQSAIMAVGAGEERAIVKDGKIVVATMMTVTMSCDHRVIDGATGARYLQTFKDFVEDPATMLL